MPNCENTSSEYSDREREKKKPVNLTDTDQSNRCQEIISSAIRSAGYGFYNFCEINCADGSKEIAGGEIEGGKIEDLAVDCTSQYSVRMPHFGILPSMQLKVHCVAEAGVKPGGRTVCTSTVSPLAYWWMEEQCSCIAYRPNILQLIQFRKVFYCFNANASETFGQHRHGRHEQPHRAKGRMAQCAHHLNLIKTTRKKCIGWKQRKEKKKTRKQINNEQKWEDFRSIDSR